MDTSKSVGSDSPIKLLLRSFDQEEIYNEDVWEYVEENLQRIVQKYPHAIDYACLLVAKRKAIKKTFDKDGWLAVATQVINSSLSLNHHHEVVWMLWLLLVLDIELPSDLVDSISTSENSHIRAMLVQAFADKKIARKPSFRLGDSLSTEDETWLLSLIAKASGFSKAKFSGAYAHEFKHLADKKIVLIDFNSHIKKVAKGSKHAISRTRYGYDDIDGDDEYDDDDDDGATRQATPLNPPDLDFLDGIKF